MNTTPKSNPQILKSSNPHTPGIDLYPLRASLNFLSELIRRRLAVYFSGEAGREDPELLATPNWNGAQNPFTRFCVENELDRESYILLLIGLAPHVIPDFFDRIIQQHLPQAGDFPQLGGIRGKQFRGFLPTGETALFIIGGEDLERRFNVQRLFSPSHFFSKKRVLWLEDAPEGEPAMSGKIVLSKEYVELFTQEMASPPHFSTVFPAQLVETSMSWEDLVLNSATFQQIRELESWINYGEKLMDEWGMRKKLKPGYRVLFHGPPGTGKTLTASLLGKYTNKEVYKVDLSMVVSKYIGETEKNLHNLFATAENKNWILFFDEADALFGKRTGVQDAHDRYANQEVSYLLQRVETYNGLTILASNFKSNIDEAFVRRFQSIIHFPFPKAGERLAIWEKAFPEKARLAKEIDLNHISQRYELSGAEIMNIVQFCCLRALENGGKEIRQTDLLDGIRREYQKEGKVMS